MAVANSSFHIVVVVDTSQESPTAHVDVRLGAERNPCCTKWQRSYEKSARDHSRPDSPRHQGNSEARDSTAARAAAVQTGVAAGYVNKYTARLEGLQEAVDKISTPPGGWVERTVTNKRNDDAIVDLTEMDRLQQIM